MQSGNAAVLVTVTRGHELLDRRRVALTPPGTPTHPHHHEGSWAVGRYLDAPWARPISLSAALELVEEVRVAAQVGARVALEALARAVPIPIDRIAIRECPELPTTAEERIADHRAQTVADSVLYRRAIAFAAESRGWPVIWYAGDDVSREAAAVVGGERELEALVRAMGERAGPPWQAAHKLAAAAAIATLARR